MGKKIFAITVLGVAAVMYLLNASWLADGPPAGPLTVIAQRGVHQVYEREGVDNATCTARRIPPPSHPFIENTLPSIAAALDAGADVVEIDVRLTRDGQFVLFHDVSLECRTNGTGRVRDHTLAELEALDVGYGYTADDGKSYPLRGKGVGAMPTLEAALRAQATARFLIQFKDGSPEVGARMVDYLAERGLDAWERLAFFGATPPLNELRTLRPRARTWSDKSAAKCAVGYLVLGWTGYVPDVCREGMVVVPVQQAGWVWGWPHRFLARMRQHQTEVMLIGKIDGFSGANFSRVDTLEDMSLIPSGFSGSVWTDRIEVLGPRLDRRQAVSP